jgi:hypothetical protein
MQGDCLDVFRPIRGLQAIVTDPPAGIGFMGRGWDKDRGGREKWIAYWAERFAVVLDACEENAVGLFWALPRTSHWTATAVEDAGWRIRDVVTHHFGQGWPKDKNALKPASEHWILAMKGKPALGIDACRVERGSVQASAGAVGGYGGSDGAYVKGTGATYREGGSWPTNLVLSHAETCERVGTRKVRATRANESRRETAFGLVSDDSWSARSQTSHTFGEPDGTETTEAYLCAVGCDCGASWLAEAGGAAPRCACGREAWWACPVAEIDEQSGTLTSGFSAGFVGDIVTSNALGKKRAMIRPESVHADSGGASRFFPRFGYHAKAPSGERHAGCDDLLWRVDKRDPFGFARVSREEWEALDPKLRAEGNVHPTVKRLSLMRWLHRLTGAKRIGDLCGGSGSGAVAALLDGVEWIGAELSPQAITIAEARLAFWRGLSFAARERFLSEDIVPRAAEQDTRQPSLFR